MKKKKYTKRCDCNGGLGGDGWATEYWRGSIVCKTCKRMDQIRNLKQPIEKKDKKPLKTESMEKFIYRHYNKWVVKRRISNRIAYLGTFETKKEAVEFRNKNMGLLICPPK